MYSLLDSYQQLQKTDKKAVLSLENRAMPQLFFFGLKFADNIHCKFNSSQASKAMLQSPKHSGAKQKLTQNGRSRSSKVVDFGTNRQRVSIGHQCQTSMSMSMSNVNLYSAFT